MKKLMENFKSWMCFLFLLAGSFFALGHAYSAFIAAGEVSRWPTGTGTVIRIERVITYGPRGNARENFIPVYEILTPDKGLIQAIDIDARDPAEFLIGSSVSLSYNPLPDQPGPDVLHSAHADSGMSVYFAPTMVTVLALAMFVVSLVLAWMTICTSRTGDHQPEA